MNVANVSSNQLPLVIYNSQDYEQTSGGIATSLDFDYDFSDTH